MPVTRKRILGKQIKFAHNARFSNKRKQTRTQIKGKSSQQLQNSMLEPIDNAKLCEKITMCNIVNSGTKDGIGNESDNIKTAQTLCHLYRVNPIDDNPFKLLNTDIEYHIIHAKLRSNKLSHSKQNTLSLRPLVIQ
jgi:hypothetical protein